jgi:hypothetical protein
MSQQKTSIILTVYGTHKYSKLVKNTKAFTVSDWEANEQFFNTKSVAWIIDNWENALYRETREVPNIGDLVKIEYTIFDKKVEFVAIEYFPIVKKAIDKSVGDEIITFTKEYSDLEFNKCKRNPNYKKVWIENGEIVIQARRSVCDYFYETSTKKNSDGDSILDVSYYKKTNVRQIADGYVTKRSNTWLTINGLN